jgi:recombination protein RecT
LPYGKQVTLIPGYRGLVELARRSGQLSTIYARVVHARDVFHYAMGSDEKIEHVPSDEDEPGDLVAVYAVARFKDGGMQMEVMRKRDIEKIRTRSKSGNSGPWQTDYEEMAKKTVVRRLCKMLPLSPEIAKATQLDEQAERGLPQDLDIGVEFADAEIVSETPKANGSTGKPKTTADLAAQAGA